METEDKATEILNYVSLVLNQDDILRGKFLKEMHQEICFIIDND